MPPLLKPQAGAFGKRPVAPASAARARDTSHVPSASAVARAYRRYYPLANRYETDPRFGLRAAELEEYLALRALLAPVIGT
jgi:hypothetical protein